MIQKNGEFADDDKLKGALNMLEVRAALQRLQMAGGTS